MYSRSRNLPLTRNAPSKDICPRRPARKDHKDEPARFRASMWFFIAKHVLGLIDRSGNREIKMWQCGNPPISPRSQRITNASCPTGSARTVRAQWPHPTSHVSSPFTCAATCPREVKVQKNSQPISFSSHSVADSGLTSLSSFSQPTL